MDKEEAIEAYKRGELSLGQLAMFCGCHYDEAIDELLKRNIPLNFGPETVDEAIEEDKMFREFLRKRKERLKIKS